MKRQNSQLSSASHRDNSTAVENLRGISIGCMSGIVHLLSKYQNNRHKIKSLTFGKSKQEKNIIVISDQILTSPIPTSSPTSPSVHEHWKSRNHKEVKNNIVVVDCDTRRLRISGDSPMRSPTLPAEIRRRRRRANSITTSSPTNCYGSSPTLVAQLMGLEKVPPVSSSLVESCSEKRRKLLIGALEKCDSDLKSLNEMIRAFRSASASSPEEIQRTTTFTPSISRRKCCRDYNKCAEEQDRQPSLVSVFKEFNCLHLNNVIDDTSNGPQNEQGKQQTIGQQQQQQREARIKKPSRGKSEETIKVKSSSSLSSSSLSSSSSSLSSSHASMWRSRSKAMIESLNEICKEIPFSCNVGETRRIGLALQTHIFRDLIDEIVIDIMGIGGSFSSCFPIGQTLPFEACKRRLRF